MLKYFSLRDFLPKEMKQEILVLYNLGLEIYEIDYIINRRIKEEDLRLNG